MTPAHFETEIWAGSYYPQLAIAVPSRLRSGLLQSRALDGIRISVKDMYHLKGVLTSFCNRGYQQLYGLQADAADVIARLISPGAVIVGKTHMCSFALAESPTQSVEYTFPFNPRGDGYQAPGGSSSGSAVAIASYDWLDFALGTDTTGSSRIPALANGCFALRPSTGAINMDGIVSVYSRFDTPAVFGRDLTKFKALMTALYPQGYNTEVGKAKKSLKAAKSKVIYYPPDFLPNDNKDQLRILEEFVKDLATSFDAKLLTTSIADSWAETSPVEEKHLATYLRNPFRSQFSDKYKQEPFATEFVRWMWEVGQNTTQAEHDDMTKRMEIFREWFFHSYMPIHRLEAILVLPVGTVQPNYRDTYSGVPETVTPGLRTTYLSPILGAPELSVPISQVSFKSRVSGKD
ncbi:amidase signature domain-containing protein [Lophiotrema nucula]|uniref:Amidase signature domain-containing protein n=1 Tax=Lophiotrema nucula TaxID=690887 RepID=A0A6A5YTT5_9PLEO|nr:amidase signature domain-containing protein [Lophiotrema nucula]